MTQFIALHNLSFQTAAHLFDPFPKMFPDFKIAADFACKHTRTKSDSICYDALKITIDNIELITITINGDVRVFYKILT